MPILIKKKLTPPAPKRGGRGKHYDAFLAKVAHVILELQQKELRKAEDLVHALNSTGVLNSKGKPWSKTNVRYALIRGQQLGLLGTAGSQ